MDGIESRKPLKEPVTWKSINFVELKTNRIIETARQDFFFKKKLLKWWCQSFLVGIENILCGFRTDSGKVIDLKRYKVSELTKIAKVKVLFFNVHTSKTYIDVCYLIYFLNNIFKFVCYYLYFT